MKTLNTFFITVLLTAISIFSNANEYNETELDVKSIKDLTVSIKQMVRADFVNTGNYFYQNNIDKMNQKVVIQFYINNKKEINLLNVESDDYQAKDYITLLLDGKKIETTDFTLNKKFCLIIKLDYRT